MKRLVQVDVTRAELLATLDNEQFDAVADAIYDAVRNTLAAERQVARLIAEWGAVPADVVVAK